MTIDVIDLRDFYSQRLGIVARQLINRGIRARWPDAAGQRVLGLGYPTPYLGLFREDSERCIAFMPAAQGVLKWPTARPALATLIDEFSMPLPDAAVDRILLVHALEMSDDPERLLREVWRVLAPSGRLIAVIPNRRGVWTRTDNTPFGHGRPYSRAQITQLLRQTWFTPASWGEALFLPPVGNSWFLRSAMAWERVGAALSLPFAGVHIVEATKQVYRAIPAGRERTRLIPSLEPVLVPSSTATRDKLRRIVGWAKARLRRAHHFVRYFRWKSWWARLRFAHPTKTSYLLIPRIEIFAGGGRRGHALGTRAMRPAAPARETLAATAPFKSAGRAIHLRLRAGDEGGQAIDAAGIGNHRLRLGLRLILRLRTMLAFAMVFARLLVAVGLAVAALLARIVVANEGLRLLRDEARLLAEMREALALVVAVFRRRLHFGVDARLRLVLPELLLRGCDQAEIMFGVLVVVLGRDRIAGRARVTRQLNVFFGDVRGGAADLDIGPVRFEHPGHRVLTAPVIVVVVAIIVVLLFRLRIRLLF